MQAVGPREIVPPMLAVEIDRHAPCSGICNGPQQHLIRHARESRFPAKKFYCRGTCTIDLAGAPVARRRVPASSSDWTTVVATPPPCSQDWSKAVQTRAPMQETGHTRADGAVGGVSCHSRGLRGPHPLRTIGESGGRGGPKDREFGVKLLRTALMYL